MRTDSHGRDDPVRRRVYARDARAAGVGDPHRPGETATPAGCGPAWIVAATVFVRGSMRETVFDRGWESQTPPAPAAASSLVSTSIRAMTAFRFGSIRSSFETVVAHRPDRPLADA